MTDAATLSNLAAVNETNARLEAQPAGSAGSGPGSGPASSPVSAQKTSKKNNKKKKKKKTKKGNKTATTQENTPDGGSRSPGQSVSPDTGVVPSASQQKTKEPKQAAKAIRPREPLVEDVVAAAVSNENGPACVETAPKKATKNAADEKSAEEGVCHGITWKRTCGKGGIGEAEKPALEFKQTGSSMCQDLGGVSQASPSNVAPASTLAPAPVSDPMPTLVPAGSNSFLGSTSTVRDAEYEQELVPTGTKPLTAGGTPILESADVAEECHAEAEEEPSGFQSLEDDDIVALLAARLLIPESNGFEEYQEKVPVEEEPAGFQIQEYDEVLADMATVTPITEDDDDSEDHTEEEAAGGFQPQEHDESLVMGALTPIPETDDEPDDCREKAEDSRSSRSRSYVNPSVADADDVGEKARDSGLRQEAEKEQDGVKVKQNQLVVKGKQKQDEVPVAGAGRASRTRFSVGFLLRRGLFAVLSLYTVYVLVYLSPPPGRHRPGRNITEEIWKINPRGTEYDILGVSTDASTSEVRRAYRRRVRAIHPDKTMAMGVPLSTKTLRELALLRQSMQVLTCELRCRLDYELITHGDIDAYNRCMKPWVLEQVELMARSLADKRAAAKALEKLDREMERAHFVPRIDAPPVDAPRSPRPKLWKRMLATLPGTGRLSTAHVETSLGVWTAKARDSLNAGYGGIRAVLRSAWNWAKRARR